jgi:hypothetical protein
MLAAFLLQSLQRLMVFLEDTKVLLLVFDTVNTLLGDRVLRSAQ